MFVLIHFGGFFSHKNVDVSAARKKTLSNFTLIFSNVCGSLISPL